MQVVYIIGCFSSGRLIAQSTAKTDVEFPSRNS